MYTETVVLYEQEEKIGKTIVGRQMISNLANNWAERIKDIGNRKSNEQLFTHKMLFV